MKILASKSEPVNLEQYWKRESELFSTKAMAAIVDGRLRPLDHTIVKDAEVEYIDITNKDGKRIYMTSLTFLLIKCFHELFENAEITLKHSLLKGNYFRVHYKRALKAKDICALEERMREYVKKDAPIERIYYSSEKIEEIEKQGDSPFSLDLIRYKDSKDAYIYKLGDMQSYYYGYTVPSTSYLDVFSLKLYGGGIVLLGPSVDRIKVPTKFFPQPKLFQVYKEAAAWGEVMEVRNVSELNRSIESGDYREMIRITEAAHEKKICEIADMILKNREKGRLILISGPSSSGKTSFAHRLEVQLKVNGLKPITISMDNYFVEREETPLDENGEYDFESVHAIDIALFNEHMERIISGEEVIIPEFDFIEGKKRYHESNRMVVDEDQPIILEGIHGLNPMLTKDIPDGNKFRIYVSPLTQLNLDDHNKISTSDLRMIRRLARDTRTRGKSIQTVISAFDKLRKGEDKYIFPYQENADVMFNSALIYELCVLKKTVYPMLSSIVVNDPVFVETKRLEKFLQFFDPIEDERDIPPTSLLREFIGGSTLVEE
ncbi:nucleoside kinase [Filifactor villosus]|uniref:Nucleoside kinase n=1 Tax=Filifactor villosus TaxID=29374 RepID=A0ABV9QJ45_9FIRM